MKCQAASQLVVLKLPMSASTTPRLDCRRKAQTLGRARRDTSQSNRPRNPRLYAIRDRHKWHVRFLDFLSGRLLTRRRPLGYKYVQSCLFRLVRWCFCTGRDCAGVLCPVDLRLGSHFMKLPIEFWRNTFTRLGVRLGGGLTRHAPRSRASDSLLEPRDCFRPSRWPAERTPERDRRPVTSSLLATTRRGACRSRTRLTNQNPAAAAALPATV